MIHVITTDQAPKAIGPYSQAIVHNNIVYCSGQIAINPDTKSMIDGGIEKQAEQVLENLGRVLEAAGSGFTQVLKCSIFLADMDDFPAVNDIYGRYFNSHKPARETVAVKTLPKNALVEISCIAVL